MFRRLSIVVAATSLMAAPAAAQQTVKIGYVTTLSGPISAIGNDMRDAFELALDHKGRKLGGLNVEMVYADDQMKPDIGKQATDKLIESDKVHFLSGYPFSNVLLASLKSAADSRTFLISNNAGASQLAGEQCSPWFFSTSWENYQRPMAMGDLLNKKGVKKLYILSPNYAAGKDMAAGVKRTFKGEVVGEEYTRWPGQLDFSSELTKIRAANPDAVWVFYAGAYGVQFFSQYAQAGLLGKIPLYSNFTVDALNLPQIGAAALGSVSTNTWVQDLDNPTNRKFVADFRKKHGRTPSFYAAQAYDGALLIDAALTAVKGDLTNKEAIAKALRTAEFDSTRGKFRLGNNHFPIQSIYVEQVVKMADDSLGFRTVENIAPNNQDIFHDKCPMK